MRNLAYYKGMLITLRKTRNHAKNRAVRREYTQAIRLCLRRINSIEVKVLVVCLIFLLGFVSGCCTISGIGRDLTAASDAISQANSE